MQTDRLRRYPRWQSLSLCCTLLLMLTACASLNQVEQQLGSEGPSLSIERWVLDNGLTVYRGHDPLLGQHTQLHLLVKAGSYHEQADQSGYAHFIEHLGFRGQLQSGQSVAEQLTELGLSLGQHSNALTSREWTRYDLLLAQPNDDAAQRQNAVTLLAHWAHGMRFSEADVKHEKAVLAEERRLHQPQAQRALHAALTGSEHYANTHPIGQRRSLEQADAKRLAAFYQRWYTNDNMAVLLLSGQAIDNAAWRSLLNQQLGQTPTPKSPPAPDLPAREPSKQACHLSQPHEQTTDGARSLIRWRIDQPPLRRQSDYHNQLALLAALQLSKQRLNATAGTQATVQQQRLDSRSQTLSLSMRQSQRPEQDFTRLLASLHAVQQHLSEAELNSLRQGARTAVIRWPIGPSNPLEWLMDAALYGDNTSARRWQAQLPQHLQTLTAKAIQDQALALLHRHTRCLITQGHHDQPPVTLSQSALEHIERLATEQASAMPFRQASTSALSSSRLNPALQHALFSTALTESISSRSVATTLDVERFALSNGLQVALIKEPRLQQRIGLTLSWPQGRSALNTEAQLAAQLHAQLLPHARLSKNDTPLADHFLKYLSQLSVHLGLDQHRLQVNTHQQGLEASVEALAAIINSQLHYPQALIEQARSEVSHYLHSNQNQLDVLTHSWLQQALYQPHPALERLTPQNLRDFNQASVQNLHQQLYGPLDRALLVVYGDFSPEQVESMIKKRLDQPITAERSASQPPAAIPTAIRRRSHPPPYQHLPQHQDQQARSDVIELYLRAPRADQAETLAHYADRVMAKTLEQALFTALRQEAGLVYGIEVAFLPAESSAHWDQLQLSYSCAPHNQRQISRIIRRVLQQMAQGKRVDIRLVDQAKAEVKRQVKATLSYPDAQAASLAEQLRSGQPTLRRPEQTLALIDSLSLEQISEQSAAFLQTTAQHHTLERSPQKRQHALSAALEHRDQNQPAP